MSEAPPRKLRILVLWGPSHFDDFFVDFFPPDPRYEYEFVSGDRSRARSPHAASWSRLWSLRRRLKRGEFDLVISGPVQTSPWPHARRFFTQLGLALRYFTYRSRRLDTYWAAWLLHGEAGQRTPLAVIDFLDTSFVLPKDLILLRAATLYFKINLYFWPRRSLLPLENQFGRRRVTPLARKLRPMTNGVSPKKIPAHVRPMAERDIDVCITGTIIPTRSPGDADPFADQSFNPIRRDIFERARRLGDRFRVVAHDRTVPYEEYLELMQRARLIVCTESFGCETFRHYNVSACGAVPLINWPYAQNYRPLEPDIHAIYFSLIGDDFERTVARALADPDRLAEIAHNAREHTLRWKLRPQLGDHVIEETLRAHAAGRAV